MWDKHKAQLESGHTHEAGSARAIDPSSFLSGNIAGQNWLSSSNYVEGVAGWKLFGDGTFEGNEGHFRGDISAASGFFVNSVEIGTSPNWFKVDASGNIWSGNATLAGAEANTFAVTNVGELYCKAATINGSTIDGTSTVGGRIASVLATAIDSSGHFADSAISTATNTILGSFTFGISGAIQIGTYVNGVTGDIKISPTGILGRDINGATTFSINATTGVAVLNGLVVGTNVGLGTAQDSAGVTTIVGNVVTTGFVNALNITAASMSVAGLLAGTITSKIIVLDWTDTAGDVAIRCGKTDFGNTTAGFILGIDDTDNLAKFEIGDATQYMGYDTTSGLYSNSLKLYETFTCGENITAGNIVCIKGILYGDYSTIGATEDTYASQQDPNTNYPNVDTVYVGWYSSGGGNSLWSYYKFDLTSVPTNFLKAELAVYMLTNTGNLATFVGLNVGRVTETWNEDDLDWNARPVSTIDTQSNTTDGITRTTISAGAGFRYIDITALVRQWKDGIYSNYGLCLKSAGSPDASNTYIHLATKEHATTGYRPFLRITKYDSSDGYIYKSDADDYNLCRSIVGIATETKNSTESCKVQTLGKNASISLGIGNIAYLSTTTGGITGDTINLPRIIEIGKGISGNTALIGIQKAGIFIEKLPSPIKLSSVAPETTSCEIIVPPDATYALIDYLETIDASPDTYYRHKTRIDQCGLAQNEENTDTFSWGDVVTWEAHNNYTGTGNGIQLVWSGNSITITKDSAFLDTKFNIYFYK